MSWVLEPFDEEDPEPDAPAWPAGTDAPAVARVTDLAPLLAPLAAAEDALSRLDALAGAAPDAVREGLLARLCFAEAAGWLRERGLLVHPRDLALRAGRLTGSYGAAASAGRLAQALPGTAGAKALLPEQFEDDLAVDRALALARRLQRLATLHRDPLDDARSLTQALHALGDSAWPAAARSPAAQLPAFVAWRREVLAPGATGVALLDAASLAARWLREATENDSAVPELAQALYFSAVLLRRRGRLRHGVMVFWGGAAGSRLPLRGPAQDPAGWTALFLGRVREAARRGLDTLEGLGEVHARAQALAAGSRRHASLGRVMELAVRQPVVTAPQLAQQLGLTHQGVLLLLNRLVSEGLLREATGRKSYRAFVAA